MEELKLKELSKGLSDLTMYEWMSIKDIVDDTYENKMSSLKLEEEDILEDLKQYFKKEVHKKIEFKVIKSQDFIK